MRIRDFIFIVFIIYRNLLFSQTAKDTTSIKKKEPILTPLKKAEQRPFFLLKVDTRAIILQPKISFEFSFSKKISLETGGSYFWTGERIHIIDLYQHWIPEFLDRSFKRI